MEEIYRGIDMAYQGGGIIELRAWDAYRTEGYRLRFLSGYGEGGTSRLAPL